MMRWLFPLKLYSAVTCSSLVRGSGVKKLARGIWTTRFWAGCSCARCTPTIQKPEGICGARPKRRLQLAKGTLPTASAPLPPKPTFLLSTSSATTAPTLPSSAAPPLCFTKTRSCLVLQMLCWPASCLNGLDKFGQASRSLSGTWQAQRPWSTRAPPGPIMQRSTKSAKPSMTFCRGL